MRRPEIICHILQSLDGNIDGEFFSLPEVRPALQAFSQLREEYRCDAVICGAVSARGMYGTRPAEELPEEKESYPRTDWQGAKAEKYAVVIDAEGTLAWESGMAERRGEKLHVIAVLQESVSDAYLACLRRAGVSYLFAGTDSLDLSLAAEKLSSQFGIQRALLSGGGVTDWGFLQAGLVDEISLVIPPLIDGQTGMPSAFDHSPLVPPHGPFALMLKEVQFLEGDVLWMRYVPKN